VKRFPFLTLLAALCLFTAAATPQTTGHHYPTPPEPMNPQAPAEAPSTATRRVDLLQLQREADDLARTAQTIPSDVASVRKGMLPKDVIEKLKQIEKMSKHLRTELNP
jgi:methionine-rich copper-binding protein CopC